MKWRRYVKSLLILILLLHPQLSFSLEIVVVDRVIGMVELLILFELSGGERRDDALGPKSCCCFEKVVLGGGYLDIESGLEVA